jgi:hypothetical protein
MTRENAGSTIGVCRFATFSSARFAIGSRYRPAWSYLIDSDVFGKRCTVDDEDNDGR